MTVFSRDFKDEVKEQIDIVDVISEYVELKKAGKNYKGLCPFHQEKTPSFTVNPANQFYHCFGCGAGGDVFNFLMEIEHITFFESLKMAAERVGLELPNRSVAQKKVANLREKIFAINKLTARFYNYLLMEHQIGERALKYLKDRGFNREDLKKFNLGFAPDRWTALFKFLNSKGYTKQELVKAGLLITKSSSKYYDRFRNRIIFPIFNSRGEVIAFGGRIIAENNSQPKYLNSPETIVYDKGDNLYGINWARDNLRKFDEAVIMEGYTDVLTAHKAGINTAIASLGTALTDKQAKLLNRYVSKVYIAYDADAAGAKATLRGLDILKKKGLIVRVIKLPDNTDPDDYIKNNSKAKFEKLKENSLALIEFKVNQILESEKMQKADNKVNITHKVAQVLAELDDPVERNIYAEEIAEKLNIEGSLLFNDVEKYYRNRDKKDKIKKNRYTKNVNKTNSLNSINEIEEKIIKAYIDYPEYRDMIKQNLSPFFFQSKYGKKIINILLENEEDSIDLILDDINDDQLKDIIMKITVKENKDISFSLLEGLVERLKDNFKYKYKFNIYKKLQKNNEISLKELNDLFIKYHRISVDEFKKGGI